MSKSPRGGGRLHPYEGCGFKFHYHCFTGVFYSKSEIPAGPESAEHSKEGMGSRVERGRK